MADSLPLQRRCSESLERPGKRCGQEASASSVPASLGQVGHTPLLSPMLLFPLLPGWARPFLPGISTVHMLGVGTPAFAVSVLLPRSTSVLLTHWFGPFPVFLLFGGISLG